MSADRKIEMFKNEIYIVIKFVLLKKNNIRLINFSIIDIMISLSLMGMNSVCFNTNDLSYINQSYVR
jgi:hypothetical protein